MGEGDNGMLYGCILNIVSNIFCTLGYAVQKIGHIKAQNQNTHYIRQPLWICGISLIAASIPIYSFSICFVSQTAMSMMPTLSILLIMFWSWLLLNEKLTSYDFIAISLLTPGTAIILLSSNVADKNLMASAFNENLISAETLIFLSIVIGTFLIGGVSSIYILNAHEQMQKELKADILNCPDTEVYCKNVNNSSIMEILSYRWNIVPMLYLPWFAGFFCCMSTTLFKSFVNIYSDQKFKNKNLFEKFGDPELVIMVTNVMIFTFLSFFMLNKSLQHFEPIYILPFEKVSLLINNLLCGGILLRELDDITPQQLIGFMVGSTLCIVGVMYFLMKKDQTSQMQDYLQEEFAEFKLKSNDKAECLDIERTDLTTNYCSDDSK